MDGVLGSFVGVLGSFVGLLGSWVGFLCHFLGLWYHLLGFGVICWVLGTLVDFSWVFGGHLLFFWCQLLRFRDPC